MPRLEEIDRSLQAAVERREATLKALLSRPRREPGAEEVRQQTFEEASAGKMAGPWEVILNDRRDVESTVPFEDWLPVQRFLRA